ncbi:hypothetical protein KDA00_01780 [Candidatus Saccharibacteria bacterium]|nr:hypothetical protein [Candidatus Saccharibacteria bacterium]
MNQLYPYENRSKRHIQQYVRINASDYIYDLLQEVNKSDFAMPKGVDFSDMRIKNDDEASWIKRIINNYEVNSQIVFSLQASNQYWQTFDYVKSNLGKGYIFYFICIMCEKKRKYLYKRFNTIGNNYLCRICHGLNY